MPKKLLLILLTLVLILLIIAIALRVTIPKEFATVKFKEPIIEQTLPGGAVTKTDELSGEVTKKDKYVVIKNQASGKEFVFTWEQIKNITESRETRSKQVDEVVEWIDFVSKMGILAAIIIFLVGLYQYQQSQKWEREKFLASMVKEFMESPGAGNARLMIDVLHLYKNGIKIQLFKNTPELVTRAEIIDALDVNIDKIFDQKAFKIRDCFDAYFNYMERFEHYIENDLVYKKSVYTYVNYQINILSEGSKLDDSSKERLLKYADFYEFPGIAKLINRYKRQVRKYNSARKAPETAPKFSDAAQIHSI